MYCQAQPPGCCHSAAVPTWKSLTSCSTGPPAGPALQRLAQRHPPGSHSHRGKLKIRTGAFSEGKTQNASRPAQASENFRNCKRGHQLEWPRTSQKKEGVKRKRILLSAPTFLKLFLREFFLRLRGSMDSGDLWFCHQAAAPVIGCGESLRKSRG